MIKKIELVVVLIFMLILSICCFVIWHLWNKNNDLNSYKSLYETSNTENKIWKSKDSSWHNVAVVTEVSKSELGNIKELQNIRNEFEGIKKSLNNIESYSKISEITTIHKNIKLRDTMVYNVDNIKIDASAFLYQDKFDTIKGIIKNNRIIFDIKHRDSLAILQLWDRKWFLGKKTKMLDIKSVNPNTIVDYQKKIEVKRQKGLFK